MTDETTDWFSDDAATFGDRLTSAREAAGLTQKELADRLGVKEIAVKEWEDDLLEPRSNRLLRLSGLLNVSIMWLLNGEGEGLEGSQADQTLSSDVNAILAELRALRTEMEARADRLGILEKKLRARLKAENAEWVSELADAGER